MEFNNRRNALQYIRPGLFEVKIYLYLYIITFLQLQTDENFRSNQKYVRLSDGRMNCFIVTVGRKVSKSSIYCVFNHILSNLIVTD